MLCERAMWIQDGPLGGGRERNLANFDSKLANFR